jgi:hypothetical protein
MTTVEILLPYTTPPTEAVTFALASIKDVYGIRRLSFDHAARTLRVEYDATRLDAASVTKLVRHAGLKIDLAITDALPIISPSAAPKPANATG